MAIALTSPAPEAEADPQYHLFDTFGDAYRLDAYPDEGLDADLELRFWPKQTRFCRRFPWRCVG